jgi:peroxiredoxin
MNPKTGKRLAMFCIPALLLATLTWCLPASAQTAPNFTLKSTDGATVSLDQYKGKVPVLIEFFATWCPHCRDMAPELAKLRNTIPSTELAILAIDVGNGDSLKKVKRYKQVENLPYTILYDTDSKVSQEYGVEGIPYVVLLDKNGTIKYQDNGLPSNVMAIVTGAK